jgi:uncharacterized membrane protein
MDIVPKEGCMNVVLYFAVAFVAFLAVDALWLGLVAPKFYKGQIGHLMATKPNFIAAAVFYLIFIVGLVYFVLLPAVTNESWVTALSNGALFGLVTYATYDLTNLATLKGWPITMVIVDLTWGMVLSTTVSLLSYFIIQLF